MDEAQRANSGESSAGGTIARSAAGYSVVQRALHWSVVVLCLSQIPTSWAIARTHMNHAFMRPDPFDLFLHQVRAWVGWLILALAMARIGLKRIQGVPSLPASSSNLTRLGAVSIHAALYFLLFALPITGTGAMYVSGVFAPIHRTLTWCLLAIAVVHAAAALWHHFVRRDEVLLRMIFGARTG